MTQQTITVILDTSIIIGLLRNNVQAIALIQKLSVGNYSPCISVITQIELGIGANTLLKKKQLEEILSQFTCHELSPEMAEKIVQMLKVFGNDRQQKATMLPDANIAATAEHLGANIYTGNLRHFNQFKFLNTKVFGYSD